MTETVERTNKDEDGNERTVRLRRVLRPIERWTDRKGSRLLVPDHEIEGWWSNLSLSKETIIELYKGYVLCEKYHSEIKSDMDLERLPSSKFVANAMVMSCAGLAYNVLHSIRLAGLMCKKLSRKAKQRRRIKAVILDLIYCAGRVIAHSGKWALRFSRHAKWQAQAFALTYERFAYG